MMHAIMSVFKPVLKALAGQSGLNNDLALAQNIFKLHYYLKKFKGSWQALNLKFMNNLEDFDDIENIEELCDIPRSMSNEMGMIL